MDTSIKAIDLSWHHSLIHLVVVVDLLTLWWPHHNWLSALHLHGRVDLAEHLVAHHVHHGVDTARVLLLHGHLLRLHHHGLGFEHVHVLRVVQVVDQVVELHLGQALGLEEVLALVQVEAHLRGLLQEGLLLLHEVGGHLALLAHGGTHGQLLLDEAALLLSSGVRVDALLAHPVEKLPWHLHEGLLRQEVWVVLEVVEGHELHDISGHILTVCLRVEGLIIAIQRLHRLEVSIAHANDDNRERQLRPTHDLVNRLVHVTDDSIRDDHQDVELLVLLIHRLARNVLVHLIDDLSEVGGSVELAVLEGSLVALHHFLNAVDARIEDISIEREAVRTPIRVGWDGAPKPVQVDLLVRVIELQDVADALDGV